MNLIMIMMNYKYVLRNRFKKTSSVPTLCYYIIAIDKDRKLNSGINSMVLVETIILYCIEIMYSVVFSCMYIKKYLSGIIID